MVIWPIKWIDCLKCDVTNGILLPFIPWLFFSYGYYDLSVKSLFVFSIKLFFTVGKEPSNGAFYESGRCVCLGPINFPKKFLLTFFFLMWFEWLIMLFYPIFPALTGGWFYDTTLDLLSNAVHLYIWASLVVTPFILYMVNSSELTWRQGHSIDWLICLIYFCGFSSCICGPLKIFLLWFFFPAPHSITGRMESLLRIRGCRLFRDQIRESFAASLFRHARVGGKKTRAGGFGQGCVESGQFREPFGASGVILHASWCIGGPAARAPSTTATGRSASGSCVSILVIDWLIDWLVALLSGWLMDWLIDWLNEWMRWTLLFNCGSYFTGFWIFVSGHTKL